MSKNSAQTTSPAPNVQRTSAGLREALFDELDNLRANRTNPAKANAVAKLADQIINSVKMEIDVRRTLERMPKAEPGVTLPNLGAPIALGA